MPVFIEGCLEWGGGKNFVGVVIYIAKKGVHAEIDAALPSFIVVVEIVVICLRMKRKGDDSQKYDDAKPTCFHGFLKSVEG